MPIRSSNFRVLVASTFGPALASVCCGLLAACSGQPSNPGSGAGGETHAEAVGGGGGADVATSGGPGGGAGTQQTGGEPGAGASGAGASGAGASGAGASGAGGCPIAPPVDTDNAQIRAMCTKRIYLAGGDDFRLLWSVDDGATWQMTQPTNIDGDDFVNSIEVGMGVVAMIGKPGLYASVDGARTFSVASMVKNNNFDAYGGQVHFGAGRFVLTDSEGTYLSTDGTSWQSQTPFPDASQPNGFGGHYHGFSYGNQTWVVFQDQGKERLLNGTTWYQGIIVGADYEVSGVAFGNGKFVAVGFRDNSGPSFAVTSTDGKTWGELAKGSASRDFGYLNGGVLFDGAKFRIYPGGNTGFTSSDGASWTDVTLSNAVNTAVYLDGHYLGIDTGGKQILTSLDGVTWKSVYMLKAGETFNINGPRLAMGYVLK